MYVAPRFEKTGENTYTVQVTSSSATVSVGQDEDEAALYTVKFVNAAGDTVSETQYEEGQNFYDVFLAAGTDPAKQAACFEMCFAWYKRYREETTISIGTTNAKDFHRVGI